MLPQVTAPRLVSLRGSDFTGLGVEVYGGLKEGIFVKKVMPQGPAAGIVSTGDRITSITIDFRHIVQEDAMTILSYASPYNVQLELVSGTKPILPQTQSPKPGHHQSLTHPLYRSSSQSDLNTIERNSRKKLFPSEDASPLKMDIRAGSPTNNQPLATVHKENEREPKKHSFKQQMREMIEEKFQTKQPADVERKGSSGKGDELVGGGGKKTGHKFGIRVFPPSVNDKLFGSKSPTKMQADNENNSNIEKKESEDSRKEVEGEMQPPSPPPVVKKRTKAAGDHHGGNKPDVVVMMTGQPEGDGGEFQRQNSLTSSGIRRDAAGIPQEMPSFMMQAANAARDNRKSTGGTLDDGKRKGKAPPRPPVGESELDESTVTVDTNLSSIDGGSRTMLSADVPDARVTATALPRMNFSDNFAEEVLNCTIDSINGIEQFGETGPSNSSTPKSDRKLTSSLTESELQEQHSRRQQPPPTPPRRDGNKIELNADDITVHRSSPSPAPDSSSSMEQEDERDSEHEEDEGNRRTASLGDLSKLETTGNESNSTTSNTLERAQSLEITGDVVTVVNGNTGNSMGEPTVIDAGRKRKISTEMLLDGGAVTNEPGLNSLQRLNRLKGASAWGNLEDAINSGELLPNGDSAHEVTVKQNGYTELNQAVIVAEAPKNPPTEPQVPREEHISLTTISMLVDHHHQQEPDTNIPDDVKVSRYPFGSLERPKSDVLKKLLGQKEELENTPSVFISADGGESVVSTIKIEAAGGEPISLTLINPADGVDNGQPSPVFTSSGTNGVSSINISSNEPAYSVPAGPITLNGGTGGGVTKFSLTADNIVTITTAMEGAGGSESQPSSIVMIDDEKLDFSLQTLDDFDDPLDDTPSPPPPPPLPQMEYDALNGQADDAPVAPEPAPKMPLSNGNGTTAPAPPPVVASKPPIVTKKPPKPEAKPTANSNATMTTPPSRIPVERRMSSEHAAGGGSLIPRNTEIKFSTATYESSPPSTRGVDQIRSTFERSNSRTEIPVLIRRTS
ncbi:AGAP011205-PA, partial [Anopheles gambiae str. PEST]